MFASISYSLEDDDFVDPFSELADPGVNARLVGLGAANAPRNDPTEDP